MKRVLYFYRNDGWNGSCWRVGPSNQVESYGRTLEDAVNALLFQGSMGTLPVYVEHDARTQEIRGHGEPGQGRRGLAWCARHPNRDHPRIVAVGGLERLSAGLPPAPSGART